MRPDNSTNSDAPTTSTSVFVYPQVDDEIKIDIDRKLDFLSQEFNREANTLCAKSGSVGLTAIGLDLKAVIDQLREQVQNIE